MKCLTLVLHAAAEGELVDALQQMPEVSGYTLLRGEGHSRGPQSNPFETTRDQVVGYAPRIRVDLVVEDQAIENILLRLSGCDSCVSGLGVYWVSPMDAWGKL